MSTDTSDELTTGYATAASSHQEWEKTCRRIDAHNQRLTVERVFGPAARRGSIYRWGVSASTGAPCSDQVNVLSRLACDAAMPGRKTRTVDLAESCDALAQRISGLSAIGPTDASLAVLWGASLPALCQRLDATRWWRLLTSLQQMRESVLQRSEAYLPAHLILGGELGVTLAWRLGNLPACKRLKSSALSALSDWCDQEPESISAALVGMTDARLVLASLIRMQRIMEATSKGKIRKKHRRAGDLLATWVAAMTTHSGRSAMSAAGRDQIGDDIAPHGLLAQATGYDPEVLGPAMSAALGASQTGGRLAWQVSLPESMQHDADAKIAILMPEWDVRRGRTHVDYSGDDVQLEIFAGRSQVIGGSVQTMIEIDGVEQQVCGDWEEVCEYSDDDVHYLEIEQPWTGDILLQRQIMLIRDDRCLLLADAIITAKTSDPDPQLPGPIQYFSRIPLPDSIAIEPEGDTREVFLNDGRRRALVIPLAASEWRIGPTAATLKQSADHHLLHSAQGRGRLFAPLWFDFQQRRFKRKRTWRKLTVADELRIVGDHEATGFRIQVGSEQWALYRSLADQRCRTVLGKHLLADFFCSRFDPADGTHDELVTVDDNESDDE